MVDNQPTMNEYGEAQQGPKEVRVGKYGEWLLVGYTPVKNNNPKTQVPIWQYDWNRIEKTLKYSGEKLRQLRKERGVGSSKKRKQYQARENALDELAKHDQELGLY